MPRFPKPPIKPKPGGSPPVAEPFETCLARYLGTEPVCWYCQLELIPRDGTIQAWTHKGGDKHRRTSKVNCCRAHASKYGIVPEQVIRVVTGDNWRLWDGRVRVVGDVTDRYYKSRGGTDWDGFCSRIYWASPGKKPTQSASPHEWAQLARMGMRLVKRGGGAASESERAVQELVDIATEAADRIASVGEFHTDGAWLWANLDRERPEFLEAEWRRARAEKIKERMWKRIHNVVEIDMEGTRIKSGFVPTAESGRVIRG